jgi:group I intron endonuclease
MASGIYQINIGDYFYFGQSVDLKKRKRTHLAALEQGKHPNPHMQRVYNKYPDFQWQEVSYCSPTELDEQEQRLLDAFWGTEGCMNIARDARAPRRGIKHSEETLKKLRGRKHSEETMEKIREAAKRRRGKKFSAEHRRKLSEAKDPTVYHFVNKKTKREIHCTCYELSKRFRVPGTHIRNLVNGRTRCTRSGWRIKED